MSIILPLFLKKGTITHRKMKEKFSEKLLDNKTIIKKFFLFKSKSTKILLFTYSFNI